MPLFVKEKKIKNQHISFEHCNQTATFLYTHTTCPSFHH